MTRMPDGDFVDSGESSFANATTTSGGGLYRFDGLSTGRYRVVIPTLRPSSLGQQSGRSGRQ